MMSGIFSGGSPQPTASWCGNGVDQLSSHSLPIQLSGHYLFSIQPTNVPPVQL